MIKYIKKILGIGGLGHLMIQFSYNNYIKIIVNKINKGMRNLSFIKYVYHYKSKAEDLLFNKCYYLQMIIV